MADLCELHCHLYAALNFDDLAWLATRRTPRWEIFQRSYAATYGGEPNLEGLFTTADGRRRVERYSQLHDCGDFARFQTAFDFTIALAHTDPEELYEVARRVALRQAESYAEYRMLLPPWRRGVEFAESAIALSEGLRDGSAADRDARLILSLQRAVGEAEERYAAIGALIGHSAVVADRLLGVDFCAAEEGHPPEAKAALFASIRADNRRTPSRALTILYHVGESFSDKSVESAVRWVYRSAEQGVDRLGHALALGIAPGDFAGTRRHERIDERLRQIEWELELNEELALYTRSEFTELRDESRRLAARLAAVAQPDQDQALAQETTAIDYDSSRVDRLNRLQNWVMARLATSEVVVESCPTSNLMIGALCDDRRHPLPRFLAAGLEVVVGADDPWQLRTTLAAEYERITGWPGVGRAGVELLQQRAWRSTSLRSRLDGVSDRHDGRLNGSGAVG